MKPTRRLKVGDTIPDFWTRDIDGKEVDSRELKGNTLITFLRYAGCPFCNLAIYRLAHEYESLKKQGCNILAVVQSTEESIEDNIIQQQDGRPPFSIVSDQQQDIYRLFGVTPNAAKAAKFTAKNATHWVDAVFKKKFKQTSFDGQAFLVPAYFLIDKAGVIQLLNYDASFYEDEILAPIYEHLNAHA
jgi:peroxiredoxin